jgi:hypothetical protein
MKRTTKIPGLGSLSDCPVFRGLAQRNRKDNAVTQKKKGGGGERDSF